MNENERRAMLDEISKEMREVRAELRGDLEAIVRKNAPPPPNAVGTCGFCSGTVIAKKVSSYGFSHDGARCSICGSEPAPLPMLDRRSETKPAAPENRRRP